MKPANRVSLYLGVGLISAAGLAWQIGLTRILSISRWYHFAFMIVSLAMLGIGISGTCLALLPWILRTQNRGFLSLWAGLFSVSALVSYLVVNELPFDSFRLALEIRQFFFLGILYLVLSIPFFFSGLCIGWTLSSFPEKAGIIYFSSLLGSGAGCFLILLNLSLLGSRSTVIFVSWLGLLTAASFSCFPDGGRRAKAFLAAAVLLLPLLFFHPPFLRVNMSPYKTETQALRFPEAELLRSRENAFSRISVIRSGLSRFAPGMSYTYPGSLPPQLGLTIDGENLTGVTRFSGSPGELAFTDFLPEAAAYRFNRGRTLIIRPRGGLAVLAAIHQGVREITVVEDNPLIIRAIARDFAGYAGNIYRDPGVRVISEIGRAFLKRTEERFDLIQIPLTDSFNATSAGAFSLHTDYLYTREAICDYLQTLSPGGILCLTRWLQIPPAESLKLATAVIEALEVSGYQNPGKQLVVFRTWRTVTCLVTRKPFTEAETDSLRDFCRERKFDLVYLPGIAASEVNRYNALPRPYLYQAFIRLLDEKEKTGFRKEYQYEIEPATDDRPFFFHFFKWGQIPAVLRKFGREFQPFGGGGYLVIVCLLAVSLILSVFLIMLPLAFRRKTRDPLGEASHRSRFLAYFFFIGTAYLFIEVALMHKFILFLSQPTYALAVVLAAMLAFSGLGSLASAKIKSERLLKILLALPGPAVAVCALTLPYLFREAIGQLLPVRILITLLALAPLAFLMGFPFPLGIRTASRVNAELLPWLWGVNGCASVISAIAGMMIAIALGFTWLLYLAGIVYLGAFLILSGLLRRSVE